MEKRLDQNITDQQGEQHLNKKIAVVAYEKAYDNDQLFQLQNPVFDAVKAYYTKRCMGQCEIHAIEYYQDWTQFDEILVFRVDYRVFYKLLHLKCKKIYFAFEPEVVKKEHTAQNIRKLLQIFDLIVTPFTDLVDHKKIFYCTVSEEVDTNYSKVPFSERKLIVNVSGCKTSHNKHELYSERIRFIEYFEKLPQEEMMQLDLYGQGPWEKLHYQCYKGTAKDKIALYHHYKFALALENTRGINGYITEKLLDCLRAGIVPVYAGPGNIDAYVPRRCYIDYFSFASIDELVKYLAEMPEVEYNKYICNIKEFMSDPARIYPWKKEAFQDVLEEIDELEYEPGQTKQWSIYLLYIRLRYWLFHK